MNELDALRNVYKHAVTLMKLMPDYSLIELKNFRFLLRRVKPLLNTIPIDALTHPVIYDLGEEICNATKKFPSNEDRLTALTEEVGELAQALMEQKHEPEKNVTDRDVYNEAIQVACVALRIAIEGDSNFPYQPYHQG